MLDIKFVRENPEVVKQNIRNKFQDNKLELVDKVLELDKEDFLRREFGAKEVILTLREDKSLIGGFILSAGDKEFDWSLRGRYNNLRQKLTRR